jgi:hypothetical protein
MKIITALFTASAVVFSYLPALGVEPSPIVASDVVVEFLDRGSYTDEAGREISFAVWLEDGELQADVSIFDPATRDTLELWLDGRDLVFEGVFDHERFRGSAPLVDFDAGNQAPICVGWVMLVCVGALVILSSSSGGCAALEGCLPPPDTTVPGEQGGVPGGGDGESESDSGGDGD